MTKEKQNNIPKAKYPWVWECESRTLIFGELAIAAFLAFLLTSAHAALIQMEVCVVLLQIVIHLLMRAMTFAGLYIILRIKTTPDEFLVYCNLTSNDGKKRMMAAGVNADFIINSKPGNPIPLGVGRKGSFFLQKNKKSLLFFYSLLKNPAY